MSKKQFVCLCGAVILSTSTLAAQTPQTPGTTGTQPTTTQQDRSKSKMDKDSVTATGCLRKGEVAEQGSETTPSTETQATPGTAGTARATGARFVLANARVTGGAEQGTQQGTQATQQGTAQQGTQGTHQGTQQGTQQGTMHQGSQQATQRSPQTPMNNTFALEAADSSVNLARHLDTRVEVTGNIARGSADGTTSAPGQMNHAPGQMNQPANGNGNGHSLDQQRNMQRAAGQKLKVTSIRMIATTCS